MNSNYRRVLWFSVHATRFSWIYLLPYICYLDTFQNISWLCIQFSKLFSIFTKSRKTEHRWFISLPDHHQQARKPWRYVSSKVQPSDLTTDDSRYNRYYRCKSFFPTFIISCPPLLCGSMSDESFGNISTRIHLKIYSSNFHLSKYFEMFLSDHHDGPPLIFGSMVNILAKEGVLLVSQSAILSFLLHSFDWFLSHCFDKHLMKLDGEGYPDIRGVIFGTQSHPPSHPRGSILLYFRLIWLILCKIPKYFWGACM